MKYSLKTARAIAAEVATGLYSTAEICKHFEIVESTFYAWKAENSEFSELLKNAADLRRGAIGEMAISGLALLLRKQEVQETETDFIDKAGKRTIKAQRVKTRVIMPNPAAVIFALKNHDPENYKDKHEVEHSGEMGLTWNETRTYAAPDNGSDG